MARTETFRVQLIIPQDSSAEVVSTFQDVFYEADGSILYPPEELEKHGMEVHVSRILEDFEKHRPDIEMLEETVADAYPEHDFYSFEGGPEGDDAFFDYSKDIIIGVCNGESDSPSVTTQVPIGSAWVREEPLPIVDGIYVTVTEPRSGTDGCDVVGVDVSENAERWRSHLPQGGRGSYVDQCGDQILVSFRAGVGVYTAESGDAVWSMTWDELLPDQVDIDPRNIAYQTVTVGSEDTAYVASEDGGIFRIALQDGQARRTATIEGTISQLLYDTTHNSVHAISGITADDAEDEEERIDTEWESFSMTDNSPVDYKVVTVSLDEERQLWSAALGTGRKRRTPGTGIEVAINGDTVICGSLNDEIIAFKQTTGDVCWRLTRDDIVDAIESDSTKTSAETNTTSFGVNKLRVFEESLYASTSLGLFKLGAENGALQRHTERNQLRIVTDSQVIHSEVGSLISTLHGRSIATGDSVWSFDILSPFTGKGLTAHGSTIIVSVNGKCLIADLNS